MPEYPFRKPDGSTITAVYPMRDAPSIGSTVEINGEPCVRLASDFLVNGNSLQTQFPIVDRSLPPIPECKQNGKGYNVIESAKQMDTICKKYDRVWTSKRGQ